MEEKKMKKRGKRLLVGGLLVTMLTTFLPSQELFAENLASDTAVVAEEKIKKSEGESTLQLVRTTDILNWLGEHRRDGQFLCGFSMETENMVENSRAKLEKKKLDMIVANNLKVAGAGFGVDTNVVTLITKKQTIC